MIRLVMPGRNPKAPRGGRNELRIVGGEARGRRVRFPRGTDLRPTPDRVRETLFNWLAPGIRGTRCLDLFAGSGALGLEALSRGAAHCVFVERDREVAGALSDNAALLAPGRAEVVCAEATAFLQSGRQRFDVVFLDPPFGAGLLAEVLPRLDAGGWLGAGARIYLEGPVREALPPLPGGWRLHRSGRAGEVGYHLALGPGAEEGDRP